MNLVLFDANKILTPHQRPPSIPSWNTEHGRPGAAPETQLQDEYGETSERSQLASAKCTDITNLSRRSCLAELRVTYIFALR
jgi:hypothetical protein